MTQAVGRMLKESAKAVTMARCEFGPEDPELHIPNKTRPEIPRPKCLGGKAAFVR
jgi:hypothetical protein